MSVPTAAKVETTTLTVNHHTHCTAEVQTALESLGRVMFVRELAIGRCYSDEFLCPKIKQQTNT